MNCNHERFESEVNVLRINERPNGEVVAYSVEVKVRCIRCKENLEFKGLKQGLAMDQATTDLTGEKLRAPARIRNTSLKINLN